MKVKLLVKLGELILGEVFSDEEPRADMFLPLWLLAFAILLIVAGIALGVFAIVKFSAGAVVGAIACVVLGIAALLCWRNQTVKVLSDDSFEYCTFLGKKTVYNFSDIKGLKQNRDSMTMYVGNGKVHIESIAILSERLVERISAQIQALRGNEE